MARTACVVGVDIGTTTVKVSATDERGRELAVVRADTPWRLAAGTTVLGHDDLSGTLDSLFRQLADRLPGRWAVAVGFAGMAEAGYALAADGTPVAPAVAWFDTSGADELAVLLAEHGDGFTATTGLRPTTRASAIKMAWLLPRLSAGNGGSAGSGTGTGTRGGLAPAGTGRTGKAVSWLNVPEWAAHWAGGRATAEWSLAARSGFMDVTARGWWKDSVRWAGLDPAAMPELLPAGSPTGTARAGLPLIGGAVVTVAGHDHLAGAIGAGAVHPDDCFDSLGTGEALIRSQPATKDPGLLTRAVAAGFERGPHLLPGRDYLFGVLGTGRLLRALLDARLGAERHFADVEALGEAAARLPAPGRAEELAVALDSTNRPLAPLEPAAVVAALDGLPDAEAWAVLVELTSWRCRDAIGLLDALGGAGNAVIAAGGWYASGYIRAVRARVLGPFRLPADTEAGTRGAARTAALACGLTPDLGTWTDDWTEFTAS
ncbi:Sugar (pentulose or hexulose) kinase [Actinacidiphila alni]|uniref:Sugar (Pentulose or hexulose) kinase n=1 Tax=Actinacidiphila alni TaxID=380248 RepID=A0A1I2IA71_9ACTN|nr:FGGY family carbohydrate kinase [Actinacidiphila alni]SFF39212.1 Sugar (pentulose or hexulose) kinase [Actinacidiphila alni]